MWVVARVAVKVVKQAVWMVVTKGKVEVEL